MMVKKLILPIIVFLVAYIACKKDTDAPIVTATGELIDGGNPAADGVGYFIRTDNNEDLKPENLPDSLKVSGIRSRVELSYRYTNNRFPTSCGICPGLRIIHIISIRKI